MGRCRHHGREEPLLPVCSPTLSRPASVVPALPGSAAPAARPARPKACCSSCSACVACLVSTGGTPAGRSGAVFWLAAGLRLAGVSTSVLWVPAPVELVSVDLGLVAFRLDALPRTSLQPTCGPPGPSKEKPLPPLSSLRAPLVPTARSKSSERIYGQ